MMLISPLPALRASKSHLIRAANAVRSVSMLVLCFSSYLGIASAQETYSSLFRDDFGTGGLGRWNSSNWSQYKNKANGGFILGRTEWGGAILESSELRYGDQFPINYVTLKLSTSGAVGANNNGEALLKGAEMKTNAYFAPPQSVGQAVDFGARLKVPDLVPGAIVGIYTYEDGEGRPVSSPDTTAPVRYSDEIDFEYLGNNPSQILTTAWNDWQRYAGGLNDGKDVLGNYGSTANPSPNHNGEYRTLDSSVINQRNWHYLKIRWIRTSNGFVVEWYVKQTRAILTGHP